MLRETMIDGTVFDKVQKSIDRLKAFEPKEGYFLAFSGGKDSVVIKALADMAGVKYDAHYSLTTVDPPELVRFIKDVHPDVEIIKPKLSMWRLIEKKGIPPTRLLRYCCAEMKEASGQGRVTITGVRWDESNNRKKNRNLVNIGTKKDGIIHNDDNDEARRTVESCYRTKKTLVNPIIDWLDEDVWQFIREYKVPYCCLYDEGFTRLGCIGCPMSGTPGMKRDFERWPMYKRSYIRAFDKMIARRKQKGLGCDNQFASGQTCFDWWIEDKKKESAWEDQVELEELGD